MDPAQALLRAQEECSTYVSGPAGNGKTVVIQSIDTLCAGFRYERYAKKK